MKSDELERQAAGEDNDLKALGLYTKALREKRMEHFKDMVVSIQNAGHKISRHGNYYMLITEEHGKMSFYPKANKIHIHKTNTWIKPGVHWIIKNLLKNEFNDGISTDQGLGESQGNS